jgi:hypothetical protein
VEEEGGGGPVALGDIDATTAARWVWRDDNETMQEVVHSDSVHESVAKILDSATQEAKLFSLLSSNFRVGGEGTSNKEDYFVSHIGEKAVLASVNGPENKQDATFKVSKPLCAIGNGARYQGIVDPGCPDTPAGSSGCLSFEATNAPGHWLAVVGGDGEAHKKLRLLKAEGTADFDLRASFCIHRGLMDLSQENDDVSFESLAQAGAFIKHVGYDLLLCKQDDDGDCQSAVTEAEEDTFKQDVSYLFMPGLFKGSCSEPSAPTACTCLPGRLGDSCDIECPGTIAHPESGVMMVCSNHGDCAEQEGNDATAAVCTCHIGFVGEDCSKECPRDQHERLCAERGDCVVDGEAAVCQCHPGFEGDACESHSSAQH